MPVRTGIIKPGFDTMMLVGKNLTIDQVIFMPISLPVGETSIDTGAFSCYGCLKGWLSSLVEATGKRMGKIGFRGPHCWLDLVKDPRPRYEIG